MRYLRRSKKDNGIDISPLIDVVFILLIFFMVSTTFVKDMKLDLERPGASSAEQSNGKALRVHIDHGMSLFVDGQPVKPWMLQTRVRESLRASTTKSILVVTDRRVPAERLIEVVDQCRLAGGDVGVATTQEAGS